MPGKNEENTLTQRVKWIDIAKGIAIILMVLGHTSIPEIGAKFIWAFHMPLFFIISGMLFNVRKYPTHGSFLEKRLMSLGIPYVTFTLILGLYSYLMSKDFGWDAGMGWGSYSMWFLEALFFTEIIVYCIVRNIRNFYVLIAIMFVSLIIGYVFYKNSIVYPYKLNVVPWAVFFYGLGYLFKDWIRNLNADWPYIILLLVGVLISSRYLPQTNMCFNTYGNIVFNNLMAIAGTLGIILLAKKIEKMNSSIVAKPFVWTGRNTLIIMGFSSFVMVQLIDITSNYVMPPAVSSAIRHVSLWILLYIIVFIINEYVPFLIGKSHNSPKK